jgi:hypothetical protein
MAAAMLLISQLAGVLANRRRGTEKRQKALLRLLGNHLADDSADTVRSMHNQFTSRAA